MHSQSLHGMIVALALCLGANTSAHSNDQEEPKPVEVKLGGEVDFYRAQRKLEFGVSGVFGLAQFDVPLPLPVSGRLAPELTLAYVSSRRIGACGLGCELRLPSIRKSNKA